MPLLSANFAPLVSTVYIFYSLSTDLDIFRIHHRNQR